jgi:hypothetical protein
MRRRRDTPHQTGLRRLRGCQREEVNGAFVEKVESRELRRPSPSTARRRERRALSGAGKGSRWRGAFAPRRPWEGRPSAERSSEIVTVGTATSAEEGAMKGEP